MTLQHQSSEFHPNANGQRARRFANSKLAELNRGVSDPMWRSQLIIGYYNALRCGHKMGTEGSLLIAEKAVQ